MHALCDGPPEEPAEVHVLSGVPDARPVSVSFISPPLCLISHPLTVAEGGGVGKGSGTVVALVQTRVSVFLRGEG